MRATILNCTLKPSPATSNTEALARVVMGALSERGVEVELIRILDHDVKPGVTSDEGHGDECPGIRERILASEILVIATPCGEPRGGRRGPGGEPDPGAARELDLAGNGAGA
jgi:multimeric flavodoxin WrbA